MKENDPEKGDKNDRNQEQIPLTPTSTSPRRLRNQSYKESQANNTITPAFRPSPVISESAEIDEFMSNKMSEVKKLIAKEEFQKKNTGQKLDSVADAINKMYESMQVMNKRLEDKIQPMEEAIFNQEAGVVPQLEKLAECTKCLDDKVVDLVGIQVDVRDELDILKGIVHKQNKQIQSLQNKLNDQVLRSMENNITLSGLLGDVPKADTKNQVMRFISEKMELGFNPNDILEAYRVGPPMKEKSRMVLIQCTPQLRKFLMSNTEALMNKFNDKGEKFYMNIQVPEQTAELKRESRQVVKDVRKREEHLKDSEKSTIFHRSNTVYINGQKHKKIVTPPQVMDLFPDKDEQHKINATKFVKTTSPPESGSSFTAMACTTKTLNQVHMAYINLFQNFPSADHISVAYSAESQFRFHDNGEFGAGYRLLDTIKSAGLQNVTLFMIREHGGINLGPRRFTIMRETARETLEKYSKKLKPQNT